MNIDKEILELEKRMKEDKNFFSCHPENGFEEIKTSKYIINRLEQMGCEVKKNIANTGVMAIIRGKKDFPCNLFRCDMDALQMDETGRMKHACGHDAHMTIMLSLAELIMKNKDKLEGPIKILFQPAEETLGGAKVMIDEGVLHNPEVDNVFALHVWSELKLGTVAIKEGPVMASTDPFDITIYGKEGHGALPEKCVDPIYIASQIVLSLQAIVGRNISPNETVVLSITSIHSGNSNNLIPSKAELKGICRTFNNEIREKLKVRIKEVAENIAKSMNGEAIVTFKDGNYPAVINEKEQIKKIKQAAIKVVDKKNIIDSYQTMCSEDFAYFLQEKKGAFIFIGCQEEEYYPQHSENFEVGIKAIQIGTQIMYNLLFKR